MNAVAALAAIFAVAIALPLASLADQPAPVRVLLPKNFITRTPYTTPATGGLKYVTIPNVIARNPSQFNSQSYSAHDFHLLVDDTTYYPVARPGLGSVDFTTSSIVAPREATNVTVSFLIPDNVETASFEFIPHWLADDGATVNFCCGF
ncbi:MAG TPA: hypothetical protein VME66_15190 [Candidatus Acidoferrales bacterium]|nr:hypothetical protein [Candidatus Acidoferrales bacterium]